MAVDCFLFVLGILTSISIGIAGVVPSPAGEQDFEWSEVADDAGNASFDGRPEIQPRDLWLPVLFIRESHTHDCENDNYPSQREDAE
jgi:hypothetical protein